MSTPLTDRLGQASAAVRRLPVNPKVVLAIAAAVLLILVVSCDGPRGTILPAPSSTGPTEPRQTAFGIDYREVPLETVAGQTTAPPEIDTGRSILSGSVDMGEGLLVGATVRVEHLVGDRVRQADVVTGEDGRFALEGVPGGRYRVRAWLAPSYTALEPEVFFLRDGDDRDLNIEVTEVSGFRIRGSTTPAQPFIGQGVNLAVRVVQRVVDDEGIAREVPLPGVGVEVRSSGWVVVTSGIEATDDEGVAVFTYSCESVGTVSATAVIRVARAEDGPDEEPEPTAPANLRRQVTDDDDDDADDDTGDGDDDDGDDDTGDDDDDIEDDPLIPDEFDEFTERLDVPPCAPEPTTTTAEADDDGNDDGE